MGRTDVGMTKQPLEVGDVDLVLKGVGCDVLPRAVDGKVGKFTRRP